MPRKQKNQEGKGMTVKEAGKKGGEATAERHGPNFYEEIGRKGGKAGGNQRGRKKRS